MGGRKFGFQNVGPIGLHLTTVVIGFNLNPPLKLLFYLLITVANNLPLRNYKSIVKIFSEIAFFFLLSAICNISLWPL